MKFTRLNRSGVLRKMSSFATLPAFPDAHRKPLLDNHAPEKSGQERSEEPKSRSETETLGVGFERKRPGNSGFLPRA
jgi:hypothetical protein